jgi:hypothetical protein
MHFKVSDMKQEEFNKKIDDLLTAAIKWRNKYDIQIYEELNKTWRKKITNDLNPLVVKFFGLSPVQ